MMASGKSSKKRAAPPLPTRRQGLPWLTIGAVVVVLALIGGIFVAVYSKHRDNVQASAATAQWTPTESDKDPSTKIPGIYVGASVEENGVITYPKYKAALHVTSPQRVDYDRYPPVGGPHDAVWAGCNGAVYATAVRDENMVHTLEHGAIWIAYNPDTIAAGDLDVLKGLVSGQNYMSLSPYPNLDQPISLQSWGHQLKVTSASDPRVKEFITALRLNQYVYPEIGASCDDPSFDAANYPFDGSARGADATPLDGAGLTSATSEMGADGATGASASVSGSAVSGSVITGSAAAPTASSGQ